MMAGTPAVELDNHVTLQMDSTKALAGPPPAFLLSNENSNAYLMKWLDGDMKPRVSSMAPSIHFHDVFSSFFFFFFTSRQGSLCS